MKMKGTQSGNIIIKERAVLDETETDTEYDMICIPNTYW
jgi:hypothetical protein